MSLSSLFSSLLSCLGLGLGLGLGLVLVLVLSCLVLSCLVLSCLVLSCLVLSCLVVWCGVVWCGVVWCGVVWCGVVWCGVVWLLLLLFLRRVNEEVMHIATQLHVFIRHAAETRCQVTWESDSRRLRHPLEPSTTKNSSSSRAEKTGAQLQDNRRSAKNDAKCVKKAHHRCHWKVKYLSLLRAGMSTISAMN